MPAINRIRIINFSYNNDTRHIMDECFNFHSGENALLSLANGGGKSVLVQLFLQPVVPGIRIQGRNIAGFFRKQKQPTFILLEWKLDGGGGYLLTGMGIIPAQAANGEEISGRIRYFTFTCKYNGANAFDILHIPLAEKRGNLLHLLPFREARDLMRDKQQKDPYLFGYFTEDDGTDYGRHLAEFGIIQDEWRNVIAKINDNEGGIEEIFQKYKTSSQLLDEWIIKNIEKSMFKDQAELHRLEEMLEKLVQEVTENESYIIEKELFTGFLNVYAEQGRGLSALLDSLEHQKELAEKLASLHAHLTLEFASLECKKEHNELEQTQVRQEEQRIELEERSQAYIQKKETHETALERLNSADKRLLETEDCLALAQTADRIQQAAKLLGEIRQKEAKLGGIKESLTWSKADFDQDERIGELEYTLKTLLEKEQTELEDKDQRLQQQKTDGETTLRQVENELKAVGNKKSSLDNQKGRLTERQNQFEKYAVDTLKKLDLHLRRNLIGELNPAEAEQVTNGLNKALETYEQTEIRLTTEQTTNTKALNDLETDNHKFQAQQTEEKTNLQNIRRDIREYEAQETEIKNILERNNLESGMLFQPERLSTVFGQYIQALAQRVEKAGIIWHEAQENILSLKNGRLHVPTEVSALLAEAGIQYDTGEAYLRGLPQELCQKMLQSNPLLPYAFILSRSDLGLVSEALEKLTLNRVVPFIAYEDLNLETGSSGRIVQANAGITLACFYEGRVFALDSLSKLVAELEDKSSQAHAEREHYSGEHLRTVSEKDACTRFSYPADHRYNLGRKEKETESRLEDLIHQLQRTADKNSTIRARQEEIHQELSKNQNNKHEARDRINLFQEFLQRDADYQVCCRDLSKVLYEIKAVEKQKNELDEQNSSLQKKLAAIRDDLRDNTKKLKDVREKYPLYRNAPETRLVEGSSEELTARLNALKSEYNREIEQLERQRQELNAEIGERRSGLKKLKLQEIDYGSVQYEEEKADRIKEEINDLDALVKELRHEKEKAIAHEASAKTALDTARQEVKRLGHESPLGPEEISGEFPLRRKQAKTRLNELIRENRELQTENSLYDKLKNQVTQTLDINGIAVSGDFVPEQDLEAQTKTLQQHYRSRDSQNRKDIRSLRNGYSRLKENYREKNPNLDNIFRALDNLWEDALSDEDQTSRIPLPYDRFYFLYECMTIHQEKLADLLQVYELQLVNLERNKKDMVEQSFLHGMRIFEEIQWISEHSRVRLQGRSRPVQMLKIDLTLDSSENARERMKQYIEAGIGKVREEIRLNKRSDEIRRSVIRLMSSRELLNTYLGNSHIPVSVYKIDYTMQNSRLKLWEDAVRENSGGEKFVVFFSVLSALMSYARARAMENLSGVPEKDTSVLIMDNPFGPISSEHLLNPLFEIARKHRTQLICLSDLKQNSIMNCFNLIYMLKIRSTAIGNKEYLKFEEVIRDPSTLQEDARLEKAVFRSEVRQMSMFGEE